MSELNAFYGSLIAGALFTAAFGIGLWLGRRGATTSQVKVEAPSNAHRAGPLPGIQDLRNLSPSPVNTPPLSNGPTPARPAEPGGTFLMEPDRRPPQVRQTEQAMGELIGGIDAEL